MAGANQLERIAALVSRVGPLAPKSRGMRIEAEDWNTLIDVMLGAMQVERAQIEGVQGALQDGFATKDHQHLGEVTVAWLDADLQSRISGQGGSVASRSALADVEQKIAGLGAEVARLTALVETQQQQLDRAAVDEADRRRALAQFDTRFAGVEGLRTLVSTLGSDVGGIKAQVGTVLELRRSLTNADGSPIDVAKMRQDLNDVRTLGENLKGVDGTVVRLRDVELKLQELGDASGVNAGGLDLRIQQSVGAAEARLDAQSLARSDALRVTLSGDRQASEDRLRGELGLQIAGARGELEASTTSKLEARDADLRAQLDTQLAESGAALRAGTLQAAIGVIDQRLATLPAQVQEIAGGLVEAARGNLRDELQTSLGKQIDANIAALSDRLGGRTGALETGFAALRDGLPDLIQGQVKTLGLDLQQTLTQTLDASAGATRASLQADVAAQVRAETAGALGTLDARIGTAADARLANLDARVASAVAAATRDLPAEITAEVGKEVGALDVPGQIGAATRSLAKQIGADQAQAIAALRGQGSADLSSAVQLLRGETASLRGELTSALDSRLNATSTALRAEMQSNITALQSNIKPDALRAQTTVVGVLVTPRVP